MGIETGGRGGGGKIRERKIYRKSYQTGSGTMRFGEKVGSMVSQTLIISQAKAVRYSQKTLLFTAPFFYL